MEFCVCDAKIFFIPAGYQSLGYTAFAYDWMLCYWILCIIEYNSGLLTCINICSYVSHTVYIEMHDVQSNLKCHNKSEVS